MSELLEPALMVLGITSGMFLLGVLLNYSRAKRWGGRANAEGQATCRDCGYVGTLSYGVLAGKLVTSANIRLICAQCESENWFIPGKTRDPAVPDSNRGGKPDSRSKLPGAAGGA